MANKSHSSARQQMSNRTFEVFRCRDTYSNEINLHHHDFYELNLFLSGSVRYAIESRIYQPTAGDILLISPNELHQPAFGPERQSFERIVLWIDKSYLQLFDSTGVDLTRCFDTSSPDHINLLRPDSVTLQALTSLMERILLENESTDLGGELFSACCLTQALLLVNRLILHHPQHAEPPDRSGSLVANVLSYINDHYADDLSLDLLASTFFISKYHLSREFNRLVGTSVHRYIIQKRLVVAKQLLSEGVPSSTVYQHCGFGDYSNFYRAFKSEYQISPREFTASLTTEKTLPPFPRL